MKYEKLMLEKNCKDESESRQLLIYRIEGMTGSLDNLSLLSLNDLRGICQTIMYYKMNQK